MPRLLPFAILLVAQSATAQSITWSGFSAEADAGARASLLPDGPWLTGSLDKRTSLEIQDGSSARPQFIQRAEGLTLLLYVDPAALGTFTLGGATLAPTEAAAKSPIGPTTAGMMLRAGTRIDEQSPASDGLTKVRFGWTWGGGSLEIRGFVPTAKIGKVFAHRIGEVPFMTPDVTLPGDYTLTDTPGGTEFVVSTNTNRVAAQTLQKKGKHTLVRVGQGAVGWIASSKVKKLPKSRDNDDGEEGGVMGGITGSEIDGSPPVATLARGTHVFAAIDGPVVGEVGWEFVVKPTKVVKNWARFNVKTRFGIVEVWARPGDKTPPPPPPPAPPQNVSPTLLEGNRISGTPAIAPDDLTKVEIQRSGKQKIIGSFKLCIDVAGKVATVKMLKATGFPDYDTKLQAGMRTWTYKPYQVNGTAVPVCTAVTFIYSQAAAAPAKAP